MTLCMTISLLYTLIFVLLKLSKLTFGLTYVNSVISGIQRWTISESPFIIKNSDLIISPEAKLIIDPGVHVLVGAGLSIKVKGILYAKGTSDHRIIFTKWKPSTTNFSTSENYFHNTAIASNIKTITVQPYRKIRLVNGKSIDQGELQLWLGNKWRSVCSENNEWSKIDSRIVCQQLGYADGNFSLGPQSLNQISSIRLRNPNCSGDESSNEFGLFSCPGFKQNIIYGRNICHLQDLVSFKCWGVNRKRFFGFWKGIEIFNATHKEISIPEEWGGSQGNTRLNVSASVFEYVDIQFAGVNESYCYSAALSSSPYPPILNNVIFANNAYHALELIKIRGPAILQNVTTRNNHGHGVKITSLMGYIRLQHVVSNNNNGDGLEIELLSGSSYHWPEETLELTHRAYWICRLGSIPASPHIASDQSDQLITITLLEIFHDPSASGRLEIWDTFTMSKIADWSLDNHTTINSNAENDIPKRKLGQRQGSVYQGISSMRNAILIKFFWRKSIDRLVCSQFANCIRALLHVSVGRSTLAEVIVQDSIVSGNLQHGLHLINPWAYIHLENNTFQQNQHEAGVKIHGGSADILLNNNRFIENQNCGLNISVTGGFKQINNSLFTNNFGHGLVVWNLNQINIPSRSSNLPLRTNVHLSNFTGNQHDAIHFYNSCAFMEILVNFTHFIQNQRNAIRVYSCLNKSVNTLTNFTVAFSYFNANKRNSILISPMIRMVGEIKNCTFEQHHHGVIWIDNEEDMLKSQLFRQLPVDYTISHNEFRNNQGSYVVHLRLTEVSESQHLSLVYNRFFSNRVQNRYSLLKPRSTCPAVIVIGSSNIHVCRNHLWNPHSDFEIASHLSSPDKLINATLNFWGNLQEWFLTDWSMVHKAVFNRIFDQNSRYTLAKIIYHPVLKDLNLRSDFITSNEPPYIPNFIQTSSTNEAIYLGGRIPVEQNREVILQPLHNSKSYYHVTKDIFIPPMGILIIRPGVQIFFDTGVGLFSQGELKLEGSVNSPVIFDHHSQETMSNMNHFNKSTNNDRNHDKSLNNNTVRLSGGSWSISNNSYHGRLEVWISRINHTTGMEYNSWAIVCEDSFNRYAAMLACLSMGLVAHPKSWFPSISERKATINKANDLLNVSQISMDRISYIDCQGHETDLSECEYGSGFTEDTSQECIDSMDLVIKCHRPGWTGIHVTASDLGSRTIISHVHIHHGGLLDYARLEYMPSLQLDYFSGTITKLKITESASDGLVLLHSDPLMGVKITESQFVNNFGSGLLVHTPWFTVINCKVTGSQTDAGIHFNPSLSVKDRFLFHGGIVPTITLFQDIKDHTENVNRMVTTRKLAEGWNVVETYEKLHPTGITFVSVPVGKHREKTIFRTELSADDVHHLHQIIIDLLEIPGDTSLPTSRQQAECYPKATIGPLITHINSILPAVYNTAQKLTGDKFMNETIEELIIYDTGFTNFNPLQVYSWRIPRDLTYFPIISSTNKLIIELRVDGIKSGQFLFAIQTKNLLSYSSYQDSLFNMHNNVNHEHFTTESRKFQLDNFNPRYTLMPNYQVENTILEDNFVGAVLYHYSDPIDRFGNLYWRHKHETFTFRNVKIRKNHYTGIHIHSMTQFTNDYLHLDNQEVKQSVERISFINYTITHCEFSYNGFGSLLVEHNPIEFSNNIWSYSITDCQSQSSNPVTPLSYMQKNIFHDNQVCKDNMNRFNFINPWECYVIGVFGSQNITIRYNSFNNCKSLSESYPCYELIAGIHSVFIPNFLDAQQNYWGTSNIKEVRERIFDFDKWNSLSLINYDHYLSSSDLTNNQISSKLSSWKQNDIPKERSVLGGRIEENLFIPVRSQPYKITSDITVMPRIELRIEAGVRLEFAPHVGILILGRIEARGTPNNPVIFTSLNNFQAENNHFASTMKSGVSSRKLKRPNINNPITENVRLIGGTQPNEGFVQFLNHSTKKWSIACDNQFSSRVAQVICSEFNISTLNAIVRFSNLFDQYVYGYENSLNNKYIWMESYTCNGFESQRAYCTND
ncbi:unnamed protein product [Heterobilharzia americana]|nr:unnamed protein product [Heterobilharzia americana]